MIEHESELRTVEEIISNPHGGDKLTCQLWLKSYNSYIQYIWFNGKEWMKQNEGCHSYLYGSIVCIEGYEKLKKRNTQWILVE